ncbi:uncharacterized protein VP01_2282g3 [Puccinia sorghi]|uniref:Uncharacterized protein n=1 Tax=Puccinia sorghi TaxID=27349 RepID=A0A0L6V859_9BASI|nr:uncharacterized protein VP01_2282g3 [Puccinia sorghi]
MNSSSSIIFELLPSRKVQERLSLNPATGGPRKFHIRRLFDLLQLCLLRRQHHQARQIWSILVRCREVDFAMLWDLGLRVMHLPHPTPAADQSEIDAHLNYMKACRNLSDQETAKVLMEYISVLVSGYHLYRALSMPDCMNMLVSSLYQSFPLHNLLMTPMSLTRSLLISLVRVICAWPSHFFLERLIPNYFSNTEYLEAISENVMFGKAKAYFERARSLDPTCVLSAAYLELSDFTPPIVKMSSCARVQDDDDDLD